MNYAVDRFFGVASQDVVKGEIVVTVVGKFLLLCAMFLTGCATDRGSVKVPPFPTTSPAQQPGEYGDGISYWDDTGSGGKQRIVIDLEQQRAYFYRGHTIVGRSVVSTGREGYDTPPGDFRITQKDPAHVSSIYGDYVDRSGQVVLQNVDLSKDRRPRGTVFRGAPMPYFLRIHGGIGMHAGYLPGYPASHGCIRLPKQMAAHFFQNATICTQVAIRQESPNDYAPNPLASQSYSPLTSMMRPMTNSGLQ
jgi:lipoprotein-anchoring transpeptidase ErfK/SrfK